MPCWAFCINQFNIVGFTFTETLGIKTPPFTFLIGSRIKY
nr:MAG TPA: hypothetical protein [Caudoviricetes sp.]